MHSSWQDGVCLQRWLRAIRTSKMDLDSIENASTLRLYRQGDQSYHELRAVQLGWLKHYENPIVGALRLRHSVKLNRDAVHQKPKVANV
jgi:hypothetical protein